MNTINQILGGHGFMVFGNGDRPHDCKCLLNERWGNGNHSLNGNVTTFESVVLLGITSCRGEVCIEIGIAQVPTPRCEVKPAVFQWIRYTMTSSFERPIEQVDVCNVSGRQLPP